MIRRTVAVAVVLLAACKSHGGGKGTGGGHGGDRDHNGNGEVTPIPGEVHLTLDGKGVANADKARAATWPRVAELMPINARDPQQWAALEVHTRAGRVTTLPAPAASQPGMSAALYPGADGIDFAMFSADALAKHGTGSLVEHDVEEVRVRLTPPAPAPGSDQGTDQGTDQGSDQGTGTGTAAGAGGSGGNNGEGGGANRSDHPTLPDLAGVSLTIKQKSGNVVIKGDDLAKIKTVTAPQGDTSTPGWDVATVLAAEKITPTAKLIVTDEGGTSVTLTAKQLDPKTDLAFMKVNKQGQIRFRLFEKNAGGGWDVAGELRGVTTIELLP
jgi:hypothetical protein